MGKGDTPRPRLISDEEYYLRWDYQTGILDITEEEFDKKIKEIREKTGKP